MIGKSFLMMLGVAGALGLASTVSAFATEHDGRNHQGGFVVPGSLDGVNPAYHPEIFGNRAVAASYGFVQSPDGTWRVAAPRSGGRSAYAQYR
jgi:hypothetical protein